MFKRFVAALLAVTMLTSPLVAQADLAKSLGAMVNFTAPGAFTTADRGALVGGNVSLRLPVKTYNLFYFDPPRFSAGCGGIDLFMGSFSYLNADAFKGLIKSIAQAAAGYFFITALGNICPDCAKWLTYLQSLATMLNQGQLNTCKIGGSFGAALANTVTDNMGFARDAKTADISQWFDSSDPNTFLGGGAEADWVRNVMGMMRQPGQDKTTALASKNPNAGNLVWRAMVKTNAANVFGFDASVNGAALSLNSAELASMIISLVGTIIVPPDPTKFDGTADPALTAQCASAKSAGSAACEQGAKRIEPMLNFSDITDGITAGNKDYMRCMTDTGGMEMDMNNEFGCLTMKSVPMTWPGTLAIVGYFLYCDSTQQMPVLTATDGTATLCWQTAVPEPNSIVGNLANGQPLTNNQRAFLSNFKSPVMRLMIEAQRTPQVMVIIGETFRPQMASELSALFGNAMLKVIATAFTQNKMGIMSDDVKARRDEFMKYMAQMSEKRGEFTDNALKAVAYMKEARAYEPIMVTTPKVKGATR